MKKSIVFLFLLMIPVFLFGLGLKSEKNEESYVSSLSEEDIVKGNSCTKGSVKRSSINNKSTISVSHFSGVDQIATFTPKNQNIEVTVSSKVNKGKLRLVICDSESIVYEFEVNEKNQTYNISSSSTKYYLKAVGENTNYTVELICKTKKLDLPSFESTIL